MIDSQSACLVTAHDKFLERLDRNYYIERASEEWFRYRENCYFLLAQHSLKSVLIRALWVEPPHRKQGLAKSLLKLLQSYTDAIPQSFLILYPIPFIFKKPIAELDLDNLRDFFDAEEQVSYPIIPRLRPNWMELRDIYVRAGFVERRDWPEPLTPYEKSLGRYPLVYESKSNESDG